MSKNDYMSDQTLVVFCCSLSSGGAERVLSILSTPFADHYRRVVYLMWNDIPVFYKIDPRVEIVSVARECHRRNVVSRLWWLRRFVTRTKPGVVVSFSAPYNMIALFALLGSGTKVVAAERVDPRSFRWGKPLEWARKLLYRSATGILAQTEHSKAYFKGALLRKTSVIYNPVTMSRSDVGRGLRTEKKPIIVSAARLVPQKRQTLLIDAFARFSKNHPEYSLVIYGDGAERDNLLRYAQEKGVAEKFSLPGSVKDIWDRIAPARMFVITSLFEGMSNSMIEAMCLGLPCISTKVSGATDLIVDGKNGYLIEIDDLEALCQKMELLHNEAHCHAIGSEAAKLYDELRVENISRLWIEYIDNLIAK